MDATYTVTASSPQHMAFRCAGSRVLRAIAAVLAEGARGEEFSRRFATPASAQFGALPRSQQSKALRHGIRPLSG